MNTNNTDMIIRKLRAALDQKNSEVSDLRDELSNMT